MVKISAHSEHFSVLVLKVIVNFGFLNLFLDIWIQNPDPDSEYGSGSRLKLNADPTGSGSETLPVPYLFGTGTVPVYEKPKNL